MGAVLAPCAELVEPSSKFELCAQVSADNLNDEYVSMPIESVAALKDDRISPWTQLKDETQFHCCVTEQQAPIEYVADTMGAEVIVDQPRKGSQRRSHDLQ
ncbi:unnamed protein product [Durusdinium trenchii]|uniref:Uncharacterized protein n=1 Tax=Durusdinium trenchii TaxID=1381693 RepID=A0ABP0K4C0_9DINO